MTFNSIVFQHVKRWQWPFFSFKRSTWELHKTQHRSTPKTNFQGILEFGTCRKLSRNSIRKLWNYKNCVYSRKVQRLAFKNKPTVQRSIEKYLRPNSIHRTHVLRLQSNLFSVPTRIEYTSLNLSIILHSARIITAN